MTEVTTAQRCDREIYHSCVNHLKVNFRSFIMIDHSQCLYTPLDKDISLVASVTLIKFLVSNIHHEHPPPNMVWQSNDRYPLVKHWIFFTQWQRHDTLGFQRSQFLRYLSDEINKVCICCVILNQNHSDNPMPIDVTFSWSFVAVMTKNLCTYIRSNI